MRRSCLSTFLATLLIAGFAVYTTSTSEQSVSTATDRKELWPGTGAWAGAQLERLTLEEKVSQMFSVYAQGLASSEDPTYERLIDRVERFGAGGLIFFQSDPMAQARLLNDLQGRARLPLLVSQDMEWGPGMRVDSATTFPRPMAIGATREPRYAYLAGYATAQEARALGTHHVYAPVADVNNNPENPIINVRSFGERPALVGEMVAAFVRGLQDGGVIATAKHFPGHGDTNVDSHAGLPLLPFERARLDRVELVPFRAALEAGGMSVMTGHLALPEVEPDSTVPATLSPKITERILRDELNFEGLVVTDALNMESVTRKFGPGEAAIRAIEAGTDIILMSEDVYAARKAILAAIREGRLTEARIDASVMRILRAKEWLSLDRERLVDLKAVPERVATREHELLTKTITRESLTLLRNEGDLLPFLADSLRLLSIALTNEDDPTEGNYFAEQLRRHTAASLVTSYTLDRKAPPAAYAAARRAADAADLIVVAAFVQVRAWSGEVGLPRRHRAFLEALIDSSAPPGAPTAEGPPVAFVSFGNPYLAGALPRQPQAYLAAYGATDAAQQVAAEALFGMSPTPGALPVSIPEAYSYGEGIPLEQVAPREDYPETAGMSARRLARLDSLVRASVSEGAFPGAALSVGRAGTLAKLEGYGYHTYRRETPVSSSSLFDLASLTKVVATTTAVMKLYDEGKLRLSDRVAEHLEAFAQNGKEEVTIRQLLTHSGGLIPFRRFHQIDSVRTREDVIEAIMAEELEYEPGTETRYSDLGFITLGLLVEEITGMGLGAYCREEIFEPLGMTKTGFRGVGEPDPLVVPTEVDSAFRRRLLQGEVHDETASLLGGVAGHAGLFSTAEDLSRFAYMLAHRGQIYGRAFLEEETVKRFTRRAALVEGSTRALGWDTPSEGGYSSAGEHFSRSKSFGHTGFTGTSLWVDPEAGLWAILLTNRVHPTRENRRIRGVRPQVADLAYGAILGPPQPLLPAPPETTASWESMQKALGTYQLSPDSAFAQDSAATDARRQPRTALQR